MAVTQIQLGAGVWKSLPRAGQMGLAPAGSFGEIHSWGGQVLLRGDLCWAGLASQGKCWKPCSTANWAGHSADVKIHTESSDNCRASCTGEGILPSDTPGTLTGGSSPICRMGFYFQHAALCPGIHSGTAEDLGCVRRVNTGIETYPEDQSVPVSGGDACLPWGVCVCLWHLLPALRNACIHQKEKISLCVYSYLTLFTQKMEKHIFNRHVRFEIMSVQQAALILQTSTPPCGLWELMLLSARPAWSTLQCFC